MDKLQPKHRAAILWGLAGLMLLTTCWRNWFTARDGGMGLSGIKQCFGDTCRGAWWFDTHANTSLIGVASLGLIAGLIATALLVYTGAMVFQGRANDVQPGKVKTAVGLTLACGVLFVLRVYLLDGKGGDLHIGWTAITAFVTCIVALVAVVKLVEPLRTDAIAYPVVGGPLAAHGQPGQGQPGQPGQQPLRGYPLSMQVGMTRMHGHMFLAPNRLYFVCVKQGGAWLAVAGAALGGAVGGALAGLATSNINGAPLIDDEAQLYQAVRQMPGSVVFEAPQIKEIKQTMWWRLIRANGNKYGLPHGLGGDLKKALGPWARQYQVRTVGFS